METAGSSKPIVQAQATMNDWPKATNPTGLRKPCYLMNVPFSLDTGDANNAWMEELSDEDRQINHRRAMRQFKEVYHFLASDSLVYLLPTPANSGLQDLVYTANLGIVLTHLPEQNTVVMSNFEAKARRGETEVGQRFFESMGYDVHVCPHKFEGEAELKHLYDNVYIGGYGARSQKESYEWMSREFDMNIVTVEEVEPYLYHLDCSIFPINSECAMVCTEMFTKKEIKEIEKHVEIFDVTANEAFQGICNSVRIGNCIGNASNIFDMSRTDKYYANERDKNRKLEDMASEYGFEMVLFNLSEYLKSGALLSCMVMHLNRRSYDFTLL